MSPRDDESEAVCRTCLSRIETGTLFYNLNQRNSLEPNSSTVVLIRPKLESLIPELTLDIIKDSIMCNDCLELLLSAYKFKKRCLETEEKIYDYILHADGTLDSIDINLVYKWTGGAPVPSPEPPDKREPHKKSESVKKVSPPAPSKVANVSQNCERTSRSSGRPNVLVATNRNAANDGQDDESNAGASGSSNKNVNLISDDEDDDVVMIGVMGDGSDSDVEVVCVSGSAVAISALRSRTSASSTSLSMSTSTVSTSPISVSPSPISLISPLPSPTVEPSINSAQLPINSATQAPSTVTAPSAIISKPVASTISAPLPARMRVSPPEIVSRRTTTNTTPSIVYKPRLRSIVSTSPAVQQKQSEASPSTVSSTVQPIRVPPIARKPAASYVLNSKRLPKQAPAKHMPSLVQINGVRNVVPLDRGAVPSTSGVGSQTGRAAPLARPPPKPSMYGIMDNMYNNHPLLLVPVASSASPPWQFVPQAPSPPSQSWPPRSPVKGRQGPVLADSPSVDIIPVAPPSQPKKATVPEEPNLGERVEATPNESERTHASAMDLCASSMVTRTIKIDHPVQIKMEVASDVDEEEEGEDADNKADYDYSVTKTDSIVWYTVGGSVFVENTKGDLHGIIKEEGARRLPLSYSTRSSSSSSGDGYSLDEFCKFEEKCRLVRECCVILTRLTADEIEAWTRGRGGGDRPRSEENRASQSCPMCGFQAALKYDVGLHYMSHFYVEQRRDDSNYYYFCKLCDYFVQNPSAIKTHMMREHVLEGITYACFQCRFKTFDRNAYKKHKHRRKRKRSAGAASTAAAAKRKTQRNDDDDDSEDETEDESEAASERQQPSPPDEPEQTGTAADVPRQATRHRMRVTSVSGDEALYMCSVCEHRALNRAGLVAHYMHWHFKRKPFKCVCGNQVFVSRFMFIKHMVRHAEARKDVFLEHNYNRNGNAALAEQSWTTI